MKKAIVLIILVCSMHAYVLAQKSEEQNNPVGDQKVYCVVLEGPIMEGLASSIKKKLHRIPRDQAKAVIIEIHTPGGLVSAVGDICREIVNLQEAGVPVYAFVTKHAWSGGAMVALACNKIYMMPQSSIGSAEPKIMTPLGMKEVGEKGLSALRAEFRSLAQDRGYSSRMPNGKESTALVEAMVDKRIEVREIHYKGERAFVSAEEFNELRNDPSIDPNALIDQGTVVAAGKLANFSAQDAKRYALCRGIYGSREKLLHGIALDQFEVVELSGNLGEAIANFLTNNWVRMLLIVLGIMGIFIELSTPGFGLPGIVGLVCFTLYFLGGYFADLTEIWEILIFILGLGLLAIEVFVIPGFGITGILGIFLCFIGLVLSLQTFVIPSNHQETTILMNNVLYLTLALGADMAGIFILMRYLPRSVAFRRLSVRVVQKPEDGYTAALLGYEQLLHKQGVVTATLRPAGKAEIEGELYDVVTEGDFIDAGTRIQVIATVGNRIVVERVTST